MHKHSYRKKKIGGEKEETRERKMAACKAHAITQDTQTNRTRDVLVGEVAFNTRDRK